MSEAHLGAAEAAEKVTSINYDAALGLRSGLSFEGKCKRLVVAPRDGQHFQTAAGPGDAIAAVRQPSIASIVARNVGEVISTAGSPVATAEPRVSRRSASECRSWLMRFKTHNDSFLASTTVFLVHVPSEMLVDRHVIRSFELWRGNVLFGREMAFKASSHSSGRGRARHCLLSRARLVIVGEKLVLIEVRRDESGREKNVHESELEQYGHM